MTVQITIVQQLGIHTSLGIHSEPKKQSSHNSFWKREFQQVLIYLACNMRAIIPAANGAAAEVPVCLSVQPVPVPRRQSVVTWGKNKVELNVYSRGAFLSYAKSDWSGIVNQMEQTCPLKVFREKRNTLRGILLFWVFPEWSDFCLPLVPCSLKKEKPWRTPRALEFSCPNESCGFQSIHADAFIARSCKLDLQVRITTYEVMIENPAAMFVILND